MLQIDYLHNDTKSNFVDILNKIEPYYILTIIIVGLIGNSISFFLFLFTKLKLQQANYILAALAIADNGFLISLLVVNLKSFVNVNIFDNSQIGCKLSVYITYLFSFLSTWYVVEFSIERLIAVYFPIKRITMCKKTTNKFSIFMLMAISLIIYSFALVTSGIESSNDEKNSCVTLTKWFDLVQLIAFIDMLITMVIPFLIIFISNISIVYKLMGFGYSSNLPIETHRFSSNASTELSELNWRKISIKSPNKNAMKRNSTQNRFYKQIGKGDAPRANQSRINLGNHLTKANEVKRIQKYSRTTRMLLIVSTTFLLLHMPIAVCKAWYFVKSSLIKNHLGNETESFETSSSEEMFERLSCYIYYLNFSLNFFLYALNGPKFRAAIKNLIKRKNENSFKRNKLVLI